ncbi:peroxisomal ATPase PEX1-like isoform X2 [Paramacrobiotus metropolitanus]|nr:peroxisomal ATPase PEX1-like isoform X2 [Paramacrobiotus metropolitanus]
MEPEMPFTILMPETVVEILPHNSANGTVSPFINNSTPPRPFSALRPEQASFPLTSMIWDLFIKRASPVSPAAVIQRDQTETTDQSSEIFRKNLEIPLFSERKEEKIEANKEYSALLRVQEIFPLDRIAEPNEEMENVALAYSCAFDHDIGLHCDRIVNGSLRVIAVPHPSSQSDAQKEKPAPSFEISIRLICDDNNEAVIKRKHIGLSRPLIQRLSLLRFSVILVTFSENSLKAAEEAAYSVEDVFTNSFRKYSISLAAAVFPKLCQHIIGYADLALSLTNFSTHFHPPHYFVFSGLLLLGGIGTGKTTIIMDIAEKLTAAPYFVHVETIQCKLIRGKRPDTLRKVLETLFEEAVHKQPSVLLFDDIEYLAANITNDNDTEVEYAYRVAHILVDMLNLLRQRRDRVLFFGTSTSREGVNELLVKRGSSSVFHRFVDVPTLHGEQRKVMLEMLFEDEDDLCDGGVDFAKISDKTEGFIMRDFRVFMKKIRNGSILSDIKSKDGRLSVPLEIIDSALESTIPASMQKVTTSRQLDLSAGWEDVGGLQSVKETLKEIFIHPVKYPTLYAKCPLRLPRGILLHGLPGTGKTFVAGVTAKEMGIGMIYVRGPELLSKYIGASESKVRDVFERARSAKPCLILFDEFDAIAPRRGHDSTGVTDRVVNQLLTEMDGIESLDGVFIIAATSRPELIDPAILRPGRIDKCLYCPCPTRGERLEILGILARKVLLNDDVDLSELADQTDGFTGADLKSVITDAQLYAIEKRVYHDLSPESVMGPGSNPDRMSEVSRDNTSDNNMISANASPSKIIVKVAKADILQAMKERQPSVSVEERIRYESLVASLRSNGASALHRFAKRGVYATLA